MKPDDVATEKIMIVNIKKWVPELEKTESKIIHNLWKEFPKNLEYPKPE